MKNYVDDPHVQKNRWWIMTAVGMFTIMSTLDASIVNIALPVISKDMHLPMNQAEWTVSIYLIVICALLLLMGKLGDIFGKIRIFRMGEVLFTIGSLFAGFNHSFVMLLAARVVQALGASMTMANSNGIVTEVFPFQERGRALGMIGSFVAVGSIAGPGLGGLILGVLPWGYIFWINVPLGILAMIVGQVVFPKDIEHSQSKIDWPGFVAFALFIVPLFAGIFIGQEIGFTKPVILAMFAVAIIAFAAFIYIEQHTAEPMLALSLFANKEFTISLFAGFLIFVTNFFFNVISPFYLENARGLSATTAGYMLMLFPIVQVIVAPLSGSLSDKIGPYVITLVGLLVILVVQVGYVTLSLTTPWLLVCVIIAVMGFGNGAFQSPNNTLVMSAVEPKDLGIAGGLNALARNMGMVVGISASTTVLYAAMSREAGRKVTTFVASQPQLFINGMHVAFSVAVVMCAITVALTAYRMITMRK
ncbi:MULTISPECIES: MFS transporter [unclassified Lacticaseibacillus]|uniref:MFS transporter n=1 Tax=unclassified Lacticaseibacillus TaxID=2759744 RepID=UPI00194333B3|nr:MULTISPECIES: MFS transporter [unclassified Lacticaseibacillus]